MPLALLFRDHHAFVKFERRYPVRFLVRILDGLLN